jgi:cell division protein FtsW
MKNFIDGIIAPLCVVTIFAFLIYIEPDLSTTIIIFSLTIAMLFLGGANLKHLIPIILAGFIAAIVLIQFSTYQKARITGWLHPEKDPMGKGFHLNMSKIAISSGGFSGVGLGKSNLKVSGLPEPHTDFIFSIICEELGFFGGVFFLLIFALLIYRGFKIVYKTKDLFYKFTAFGMTMLIAIHVIINVSVVTGLFPTTGITLPFFSYGGSSFITFLIAMGILLNVSTKVKN